MTLSRALVSQSSINKILSELQQEMETFIESVTSNLPCRNWATLKEYQQALAQNSICSQVMKYCESSWPEKCPMNKDLIPYWRVQSFRLCFQFVTIYFFTITISLSLLISRNYITVNNWETPAYRDVGLELRHQFGSQIQQMIHQCPIKIFVTAKSH